MIRPCLQFGFAAAALAAATLGQSPRGDLLRDGATVVTLVSPHTVPATPLAGVTGMLRLDPSVMVVIPGEADPDRLRAMPEFMALTGSPLHYQVLTTIAGSVALSPLGSLNRSDGRLASEARARAAGLVAAVANTPLAPGWTGATLGAEARAFYRPDVEGPAYYEFQVVPQGFVVVATGSHDYPIAHWRSTGPSLGADLDARARARGRQPAKLWKLDTLAYAAEDQSGALVAQIGDLPAKLSGLPDRLPAEGALATMPDRSALRFETWSSWRELKESYADTYGVLIDHLCRSAAPQWSEPNERTLPNGQAARPEGYYWDYKIVGSSADQRMYGQWDERGCLTGCGPTAWAMLFGWCDLKAAQGTHARWKGHQGIYRKDGGFGVDAVAPALVDTGVQRMIREIRRQIATFCLTGLGATFPWDMDQVQEYLTPRDSSHVNTFYNSLGFTEDRIRDFAVRGLRDYDTPAIIGTGWLSHYPLAWQHARQCYQYPGTSISYCSDSWPQWFYVNQGWGGAGDGWVPADTWFGGRIFPF